MAVVACLHSLQINLWHFVLESEKRWAGCGSEAGTVTVHPITVM